MKPESKKVSAKTATVTAEDIELAMIMVELNRIQRRKGEIKRLAADMGIGTRKSDLKPHKRIRMKTEARKVTAANIRKEDLKLRKKTLLTAVPTVLEAHMEFWTRERDLKLVTETDMEFWTRKRDLKPQRGILIRKLGRWALEMREPVNLQRMWLGTYTTREAVEIAYEVAVVYMREVYAMGGEEWSVFVRVKAAEVVAKVEAVRKLEVVETSCEDSVDGISGLLGRVNLNKVHDPVKLGGDDDDLVKGLKNLEIVSRK